MLDASVQSIALGHPSIAPSAISQYCLQGIDTACSFLAGTDSCNCPVMVMKHVNLFPPQYACGIRKTNHQKSAALHHVPKCVSILLVLMKLIICMAALCATYVAL